MTTPETRRRNSYGYLQDSARAAANHFTRTPKGVRVDLRLYVYPRDHGTSVIVRDDSGTEQAHIRIDKPTEAVVALAAIWEEAVELAQRKAEQGGNAAETNEAELARDEDAATRDEPQ